MDYSNTSIISALVLSALSGILDGATRRWSKPKTKVNSDGTWSVRPAWIVRVILLFLIGMSATGLLYQATGINKTMLLPLGLCVLVEVVSCVATMMVLLRGRKVDKM